MHAPLRATATAWSAPLPPGWISGVATGERLRPHHFVVVALVLGAAFTRLGRAHGVEVGVGRPWP